MTIEKFKTTIFLFILLRCPRVCLLIFFVYVLSVRVLPLVYGNDVYKKKKILDKFFFFAQCSLCGKGNIQTDPS